MAMIEMMPEPEPRREPTLLIEIGNEEPIDAEEIGRFVRELAIDYRRKTRGRLVVARLEIGSTFIEIIDAVVVYGGVIGAVVGTAEAVERMSIFYQFLKRQLQGTEKQTASIAPSIDQSPARLLEIAANAGANLKISRGSGKSKETVELSFSEVSIRNESVKARKKKKQESQLAPPKEALQIENLTDRLSAQAGADHHQMEGFVEVVVELLKSSGQSYLLPALAMSLETKSLSEMAAIVRRHIEDGKDRLTISRE